MAVCGDLSSAEKTQNMPRQPLCRTQTNSKMQERFSFFLLHVKYIMAGEGDAWRHVPGLWVGAGSCWPQPHSTKYLLSNLVRGTDSWVSLGNLSRLLPWVAPQRPSQYPTSDAFFPPCLRRRPLAWIPTACATNSPPIHEQEPFPSHSPVTAQPSPNQP